MIKKELKMFFAKAGEYEACKMFSLGHLILFLLIVFCVMFAIKYTKIKTKEDIKDIIKRITIIVWFLEVIKIVFNLINRKCYKSKYIYTTILL